MRLDAMHHFTSKLPSLELDKDAPEIGQSTSECLQSGAMIGALREMESFIEKYNESFENINVLLTGGDMHFFVYKLKRKIFAAPNLILIGLNQICEYNRDENE